MVPKLGCWQAAFERSAVVLSLLFVLFLIILRRIHYDNNEKSLVPEDAKTVLIMYLC